MAIAIMVITAALRTAQTVLDDKSWIIIIIFFSTSPRNDFHGIPERVNVDDLHTSTAQVRVKEINYLKKKNPIEPRLFWLGIRIRTRGCFKNSGRGRTKGDLGVHVKN